MGTDHFSSVAAQYVTFRPTYPEELFDWLAGIAPQHVLAWDCGAGSGQATVALAARFSHVLGTDISAAQLAAAPQLPNIEYRVAPAESSGLPERSADLVTVAQAMHWFDLPRFHAEVRRVLKPQGVIAAWGYNRLEVGHADVRRLIDHFYDETVGPWWPPERVHVENAYRDLPFPYARIDAPHFALAQEWTRGQLTGYLRSWSAVACFKAANGYDPVETLAEEIAPFWPEGMKIRIAWPLFMLAGRNA